MVDVKHNTPSVSVVIPTHNDAGFLDQSVPSVLDQQWPGDLEILIIDDGSRVPAAEAFRPPADNVRIHRQDEQGVSEARNTGIRLAQGDYVAFLDADDLMLPGRLERQTTLLENHPEVGLVGGDVTRRDLEGDEKSWGIFEAFGVPIESERAGEDAFVFATGFQDQVLLRYPFNTSVITVRRSALEPEREAGSADGLFADGGGPVGPGAPLRFDPSMICWEDWDFVARLARRGRVGYIRRPVVLYRKRPGSITTTPDPRKFLCRARMFERFSKTTGLDPTIREKLLEAEIDSLLTASWEYRSVSRIRAFLCALRSFRRRPGGKTLKAILGAAAGSS